jgi:hypothetical protein
MSVADHEPLTSRPRYSYYEENLKIPGYGHQPMRCQPLRPVGFCDHVGHVMLGQSSCETRSCPEHWDGWVRNATANAVTRVAAYREAQPDGPERRLLHVVASPDDQDVRWTEDAIWDRRRDAYDAVSEVGVRGGVCIPHPYRANERGKQEFQDVCDDPATDWSKSDGLWRYLRQVSEDHDELLERVEPGPHYHMLAACEDFDADAIPDGWVVKNVRSFERFHRHNADSYDDMIGGMWYLATHGAVSENRMTVTYFGEMHPATFRPEEELTAAAYDGIKAEVEAATTLDVEDDEGAVEGAECPREECDGEIVPIERVGDWLAKGAWVASVPAKQRRRLKGSYAMTQTADRPPPTTVAGDRDDLLEWLEEIGENRPMPIGPPTGTVDAGEQVGVSGWGQDA